MYTSKNGIIDELRRQFKYGGIIQKLIFINIGVFLIINIMRVGLFLIGLQDSAIIPEFMRIISMPINPSELLWKPWTILSYMFVHKGFMHILFNMLYLYWFGRILADLGGEKRILPVYFLGGIIGAIFALLSLNFLPAYSMYPNSGTMIGASAAVMAIATAAAAIAPEYELRLFLFGRVKLKYFVLVLVLLDVFFLPSMNNSGGHLAHIGGALTGLFMIYGYKRGYDVFAPMNRIFDWFVVMNPFKKKSHISVIKGKGKTVETTAKSKGFTTNQKQKTDDTEEKLNEILEKIREGGYETLSEKEKRFLAEYGK